MAEGSGRVTELASQPRERDPNAIKADIGRQRQELTALLTQLKQQGRDLTDVGLQVRRHALGLAAAVLAVGGVVAGSIALRAWRARHRNTLTARSGRLRQALSRMIDRPERVAVEPTVTQRIIGAAGSAAAAFLIKAALERVTRRVNRPRENAPEELTAVDVQRALQSRAVSPAPGEGKSDRTNQHAASIRVVP